MSKDHLSLDARHAPTQAFVDSSSAAVFCKKKHQLNSGQSHILTRQGPSIQEETTYDRHEMKYS